MSFQCFDIHSSKEPQFGFTATVANGRRLCCLGDEPFNPLCREYAQDADRLMHEAFTGNIVVPDDLQTMLLD